MNQPSYQPWGNQPTNQPPTENHGQQPAYPPGLPQENQPPAWQSPGTYQPGFGTPGYPIAIMPKPFSARGRAVATVYALGGVMLLNLLSVPLTLWENSLVREYGVSPAAMEGELPSAAMGWLVATAGLGFFAAAAAITTIVLFLMWMHRAYRILEINNLPGLKSSAGWAVGWWFIPFANLVKPYEVVKEIFERSERQQPATGFAYGARKESPLIVGAWWLTWIVASIATNVSGIIARYATSPEQYMRGNWIAIGAILLYLTAGALAIMVIRDIDNRQWRAFCSGQKPPSPQPQPVSTW